MNQMLTGSVIERLIASWFERGENYKIEWSGDGYDIAMDFAWALRIRVVARGRDRTCYLSTADLCLPTYEVDEIMREGFEAEQDSVELPRLPTHNSCGTMQ